MNQVKLSCLVIGGSGALGSEICRVLHNEGCSVAFTYYQNETKAQELALELSGTYPLSCDLKNCTELKKIVQQAVDHMGSLDALIFASGISGGTFFYENIAENEDKTQEITPERFDEMVAVNSKGVLFCCLAAIPFLKKQPKSNIVIMASLDCAKNVPSPIHFAMSKTALKGMMATMAKEWGGDNICINLIAPGILEGGASTQLGSDRTDNYLKHCSLKRFGKMREAADIACWLAMENSYLTGQSVLIDGGL